MSSSEYKFNISEDEDVPLAKLKINGKQNRKLSIADRSSFVSESNDRNEDKKVNFHLRTTIVLKSYAINFNFVSA